jgi:CheY-like chemotaxis protein
VHNSLLIILVVEDEPLIQDMVHEALSDGGFGTKIAGSGEAAVKLLEDNEGKYRVLITDIHFGVRVMGWDVAKRARELNREIEAHRSRAIAARLDGRPMTKDDVRVLHDQLAELHRLDMIDGCTREIVEGFMADLVDPLPE